MCSWEMNLQLTISYVIISKCKKGGRKGATYLWFHPGKASSPRICGFLAGLLLCPKPDYGPKQQQQFPCTNADPEMSLSIDFERKTWSWNYGFDGQALMACHRCAVRLFLLLQMRDRSWTRCKAELLKAGHRLITWICQNQPQFVTPWIYRSPIFLLPVGFP